MAEPRLGQVHQDTTTDPTMHPASFPQTVINRAGKVGSRVQNTQRSHHHGLGLQCAIYTTVIRRTWCLTAACFWFCSSFSLLSMGKPFLFIVMRNGVHVSSKTINLNASYCHWPTVSSFDMISTTDSGAPALLSHSSSKDTGECGHIWMELSLSSQHFFVVYLASCVLRVIYVPSSPSSCPNVGPVMSHLWRAATSSVKITMPSFPLFVGVLHNYLSSRGKVFMFSMCIGMFWNCVLAQVFLTKINELFSILWGLLSRRVPPSQRSLSSIILYSWNQNEPIEIDLALTF